MTAPERVTKYLEVPSASEVCADHSQLSPVLTSEMSRLFSSGYALLPLGGPDGKQPTVSFRGRKRLPLGLVLDKLAAAGSLSYGIRLKGVLVVDVDTDTPEARDYVACRFGTSPCKTRTSRGFHLYFRHVGSKPPQVRLPGISIDFKSGDNEYVVGPQSERPNGVVYWPEGRLQALQSLPWFQDHGCPAESADRIVGEPRLYPEGTRHTLLKQEARALALSSATFEEASARLTEFRDTRLESPNDFPAPRLDGLLKWFWDRRQDGSLWGGQNSTVNFHRPDLNVLFAKGNNLATTLYVLLVTDHGHKKDAEFAIVPDALRSSGRLTSGRRQIYLAIKALEELELIVCVRRPGGKRNNSVFRLERPKGEGERGRRSILTLVSREDTTLLGLDGEHAA
jgi:hypothetical protein